jgi:hypothetical protein
MFDGKKYENMLSHDYRKYLINGGNIKLRHLKEDKIFLKFYNNVNSLTSFNLQRSNQLNEITSEKISLTHGNKQLTSLNGNKDSKICLRNNNVKPLNEKSHPIDRIIEKYF